MEIKSLNEAIGKFKKEWTEAKADKPDDLAQKLTRLEALKTGASKIHEDGKKMIDEREAQCKTIVSRRADIKSQLEKLKSESMWGPKSQRESDAKSRIEELDLRVRRLEHDRTILLGRIAQRARLAGAPAEVHIENSRTRALATMIASEATTRDSHLAVIADEQAKQKDQWRRREDEIKSLTTEWNTGVDTQVKLGKELESLRVAVPKLWSGYYEPIAEDIDEIKRMIKEARMKDQYVTFADQNGITWDDDSELFEECNKVWQERLKGEHFEEGGCPGRYYGDGDCAGWWVREHRCECGNFKGWTWNEDGFDPSDLLLFSLDDTRPYGRQERLW